VFNREYVEGAIAPACCSSEHTKRLTMIVSRGCRRAKQMGCTRVERANPFVALRRTGWVCQECGTACDPGLYGQNRHDAPEADHRVPLIHGGAHTEANLQCVHRRCNNVKGRREAYRVDATVAATVRGMHASGVTPDILALSFRIPVRRVTEILAA
jgi:5-methylcytosine-specific restriction endonuclease McrA